MGQQQGNRKKAKTLEQRQIYYKAARGFGGDETESKTVQPSLDGSDNSSSTIPIEPTEKVKRGSIKGWLVLHKTETITSVLIALLIPVILGSVKWVIDIKAEQIYLSRVLDETKERIEQLHSSESGDQIAFVTKENLELKLEIVERDFKALIPDISGIEKRLDEIEKELDGLTGKGSGSE